MNTGEFDAQAYFAHLREEGRATLQSGQVKPATMKDGVAVPLDYCLSTIARLVRQRVNPADNIVAIQDALGAASGEQFLYPKASLHATLLGCTQRASCRATFTPQHIHDVGTICADVLSHMGTVRMSLKGLCLAGNSVIAQAFPHDGAWARYRQRLEDALVSAGESPISYPNKYPVHINLMRITHTSIGVLHRILGALDQFHDADIGDVEFDTVEYVITDFVVSDSHMEVVRSIDLSPTRG